MAQTKHYRYYDKDNGITIKFNCNPAEYEAKLAEIKANIAPPSPDPRIAWEAAKAKPAIKVEDMEFPPGT